MLTSMTGCFVPVADLNTPEARFADLHAGCVRGLSDELDAVRRDLARWGGDLPVDVTGSRLDRREGGHYLYAMSLERRVQAPPFTTTEIRLRNGKALTGTIEEVHEKGQVFIVATEVPIPEEGRGAILAFTPTEVLEAMLGILATVHPVVEETKRERVWRTVGLRETGSSAEAVAHPVLTEGRLNAGQRGAACQVLGSELTAVIGPPGTGKTLTLGATVTAAVEALERKVLVVAHTNGALDLALKAVIDVAQPALLQEGRLVRIGRATPVLKGLAVSLKDAARRQMGPHARPDLVASVEALEREVRVISPSYRPPRQGRPGRKPRPTEDSAPTLEERVAALALHLPASAPQHLVDAVDALHEEVTKLARGVLRRASVIGVTLSSLALRFEAIPSTHLVVVDEASMAQLPAVMIAGLKAKHQLAVFGDPMQLPPVVQANSTAAEHFLKRTLYHQLGVADPTTTDPRCVVLRIQYRMDPPIRAAISALYYQGVLEDAPGIALRAPMTGPALLLVDTSKLGVTSERVASSRQNVGHQMLVAALVDAWVGRDLREIGIIAPFNAHIQGLRRMLDRKVPSFQFGGGFVRTIHRAQGGEQDIILLDLVDAPPSVSMFLDGRRNPDLPALLNVGMSRARRQLVVLAHTQSLRAHYGHSGAHIMRVLETLYRSGTYVAPASHDEAVRAVLAQSATVSAA